MTPQGNNKTNPEVRTKWSGLYNKSVLKKKKNGGKGKGCARLKEIKDHNKQIR